eukprot:scaffold5300_cov101-Isochrysis_galbana.AAC.3
MSDTCTSPSALPLTPSSCTKHPKSITLDTRPRYTFPANARSSRSAPKSRAKATAAAAPLPPGAPGGGGGGRRSDGRPSAAMPGSATGRAPSASNSRACTRSASVFGSANPEKRSGAPDDTRVEPASAGLLPTPGLGAIAATIPSRDSASSRGNSAPLSSSARRNPGSEGCRCACAERGKWGSG